MSDWFEITILIVAALVAIVNRIVQASREYRRRQVRQRQEEERGALRTDDAPAREPVPELRIPRVEIPPSFGPPPVPVPPRRPPRRPARPAAEAAPPPPPVVVPALRRRPPAQVHSGERMARMHRDLVGMLRGDPLKLREAVLLREILGPPRALASRRLGRRR